MESTTLKQTQTNVIVNSFIRSVYNWMAIGLGLTAFIALYVAQSPSILNAIFGNPIIFYGLIIGELVLVFSISARVHKMKASTATGLFMLYAALNGATLVIYFYCIYEHFHYIDIFRLCRDIHCMQHLRNDDQKGFNIRR